jgi:hypothetical protein
MPVDFTGNESPDDIVKAAIDEFERHPLGRHKHFSIFYEGGIPKMKYEFAGGPIDFSCIYRLDIMLLPFFGEAERIFDRLARPNIVDMSLRDLMIRYLAFQGMSAMLSNLPLLQLDVFGNNLEEVRLVISSLFLHSMVAMTTPRNDKLARIASKTVKQWIEETLDALKKRRREYLVGFMNKQTLLNMTTAVGRPPGTTKPEEKKRAEAMQFEEQVETALRKLWIEKGEEPTKTAVAEDLNIGSPEYRLTSFINRLTRRGINYQAIVDRVKRSLKNLS